VKPLLHWSFGSGEHIFLIMGIEMQLESDFYNGRRTGFNEQSLDLSVHTVFQVDHLADFES